MTWFGWQQRSRWLESGAFVCPGCQTMRSMSTRQRQRAFVVLGLRVSRWSDMEQGEFAECESCGAEIPGHHVLHGSTEIAQIEAAGVSHDAGLDDELSNEASLEQTQECPRCGRVLGSSSRICPRCEYRLG